MNTIAFLGEWALRSAALILCGSLLVRALRVKDPAIRLAAWTALLAGSLAIPLLNAALPQAPMPVAAVGAPAWAPVASVAVPMRVDFQPAAPAARHFEWPLAALVLYGLGAAVLLLRLAAGLVMSGRLLRASRATGRETGGIEIRESDGVAAPVVLGILRAAIVLPADWRAWDAAKLEAVVAHERSHVRRCDPLVQMLSAMHRALLWHSPLSWFLHKRIVRAAEDASDDAAVAAVRDRASYAEMLLGFMRQRTPSLGVGMARYGRPEDRIQRILEGTAVSRGLTRWRLAAIVALAAPLAYLAAAAAPQTARPAPPAPAASPAPPPAPAAAAMAAPVAPPAPPTPPQDAPPAPRDERVVRRYVISLGDRSMSGSWNSDDSESPEALRQKYGNRFAWFRLNDGSEFETSDPSVLNQLEKAMEPQKEVNRKQSGVNAQQSVVNGLQGKVNSLQSEVNALQQQVNRRQQVVNRIQEAVNSGDKDEIIRRLQAAEQELRQTQASEEAVNRKQQDVNAEQQKVNAEQQKVNAMQQEVNQAQRRVSAEWDRAIDEILQSAVRRHLAERLM